MVGSKRQLELLNWVAGADPALRAELASWMDRRKAFEAFVGTYRDKVRKKLRVARDADAIADVRAELLVAFRLLGDRRFTVAFEAYGSGIRGPDLTVTFRAAHPFNVEVTRLRDPARLADAVLAKMRQLPPRIPNVIALVRVAGSGEGVAAVARQLKLQADRREDRVFARAGFVGARDFYARYLRASAIVAVDDVPGGGGELWSNPEARSPLPTDATVALMRALTDAWAGAQISRGERD
jgi:hypothetical protein